MFERYTERARRVIFFARYEASSFGSPYIEVEHMLLAILRETRDDLVYPHRSKLSKEISSLLPQNKKLSTSVDLPLSHSAKRVLAFGAEEAERLAHRHIDTHHLLLGVLREESAASAALNRYGITLDKVREHLREPISSESGSVHPVSELHSQFAVLTERLTPEVEPATVFLLRAVPKDQPR